MRTFRILVLTAVAAIAVVGWAAIQPGEASASAPLAFESLGALTFSPEGVLFAADSYGAAIYALELSAAEPLSAPGPLEVPDLDRKVASLLGTTRDRVRFHDMAVHPSSGEIFLSVSRGSEAGEGESTKAKQVPGSTPHLVRLSIGGELDEVDLAGLAYSKVEIPNAYPAGELNRWGDPHRLWTVAELGFADGKLLASGLSNEEWSSTLFEIPYPFRQPIEARHIRIFHTAHGRWETGAPARVFVPYERGGELRLFAGFSCTPLVDLSFRDVAAGRLVEGRTVAELGAGNHVLDMVQIERGTKRYVLLANHLHPAMLFDLDDVPGQKALTWPTNRAGIDRQLLPWQHIERLANFGPERVVMLQRPDGRDGRVDLRTVDLSELPLG